ncbi:hypothetical protein RYX36_029256 [Vicia faba]
MSIVYNELNWIWLVLYICMASKTNKVSIVKPWTTGISGQLQKALVTGVPKLKRIDLEVACEDFSNVIGKSPIGTLYKGTLSSGVEIAVASVSLTLSKTWTKNLEAQFKNKIDTLSKVNHRNFVNLIGYCEEEEPFTRMLVFEYAPNGTLFEHLHVKEAEHLNWGPRLRIATGMAYCLQYMHGLDPPVALTNLSSSTVHLTDDHAAKISDLSFSRETDSSEKKPDGRKDIDIDMTQSTSPASNVYSLYSISKLLSESIQVLLNSYMLSLKSYTCKNRISDAPSCTAQVEDILMENK